MKPRDGRLANRIGGEQYVDDYTPLPAILRAPDGVTAQDMERAGWQLNNERLRRDRLILAHVYKRHASGFVPDCRECAVDFGVMLHTWFPDSRDVMRFFR